jgi:hypothetical protein
MRSLCCLCACVIPNVARQRLGKHVLVAKNAHEAMRELLDAVFTMQSVSYQILNMQ